jgi:hypothetical protein
MPHSRILSLYVLSDNRFLLAFNCLRYHSRHFTLPAIDPLAFNCLRAAAQRLLFPLYEPDKIWRVVLTLVLFAATVSIGYAAKKVEVVLAYKGALFGSCIVCKLIRATPFFLNLFVVLACTKALFGSCIVCKLIRGSIVRVNLYLVIAYTLHPRKPLLHVYSQHISHVSQSTLTNDIQHKLQTLFPRRCS